MKLLCLLFGHKWSYHFGPEGHCDVCGLVGTKENNPHYQAPVVAKPKKKQKVNSASKKIKALQDEKAKMKEALEKVVAFMSNSRKSWGRYYLTWNPWVLQCEDMERTVKKVLEATHV